ncbi:MAG: hypothetical protein ABJB40_11900 [Acidobacteriota bacterium]
MMTAKTKIYIGLSVAVIFAIGMLGGAAWSDHKIAKLERAIETAKQEADSIQRSASQKEAEAREYKQKIEYLEGQLADIQTIARKQDEELEKLNDNSRHARSDVERARRTRSVTATADELCAKLAELGHGCEE